MILTCPECSTKYLSQPEAIGPNGRTVRCAKCEATWFVSAEEALKQADHEALADAKTLEEDLKDQPVDVAETPAESDFGTSGKKGAAAIMRDKADADKVSRRRRVIWAIWLIPLFILLLAAILGYIFRQEIVNRVPESATIYKSFGVTVKTAGLEIESPTARTAIIDGQTVLVVNSSIHNVSSSSQSVPLVELTLHNGSGEQLAAWYVEPDKTRLSPNGRLEFATQYPDPPVDAVKLRYDFAKN